MTNKIKKYSGLLLIIVLLITGVTSCNTVNPVTGKKQFTLLSEEQEQKLGSELYPKYTQAGNGIFQDDYLQKYVNEVGKNCSTISHRPNLDYEYNVVNSSTVNAYALPGGKITITRGLIARMDNEAELASVFGHEVGHVAAIHAARAYTRGIVANVVLAGVGYYLQKRNVKYAEYYMLGGQLITGLVMLKYSREQERQADDLGIEYMVKAGYDPHQFVATMQILKSLEKREPSKFEEFFRDHPLTAERIVTAEQRVNSQYSNVHGKINRAQFQLATKKVMATKDAYEHFDNGVNALAKLDTSKALRELKDASDMAPDQAIIRAYHGRALYESGRAEAGYKEIAIAQNIYPDEYHIRLFKGMCDLKIARFQEALSDLKRADQLIPNQAPVQFFLGKTYESINNRNQAAAYYTKFLNQVHSGDFAKEAKQKLEEWGYLKKEGK